MTDTDFDDDGPACTLQWPGDICYCTRREGCQSEMFALDEDDEVDGEDPEENR